LQMQDLLARNKLDPRAALKGCATGMAALKGCATGMAAQMRCASHSKGVSAR
jgi:hypothetical protein